MRTSNDVREGVRGSMMGTVTAVTETRNQFTVAPDDDRYGTVVIQGDSVSTTYSGFGGMINGAPEVFQGSAGITNVREGDRVEVRGVGSGAGQLNAETVVLLGRSVPADQVGVGQTRTPSSVSTPTATNRQTTPPAATRTFEGTVRQISAAENRLVIETDRREMITVRGAESTPVYYRQDVYHMSNLEVGDRVRVEPQSASSAGDIRARSIDVLTSIQDSNGGSRTPVRDVGTLGGRVTSVDRRTDIIRITSDTGRGADIRLDLGNTVDDNGHRVRASDVRVGDRLEASGSYNGDLFVASTLRFVSAPPSGGEPATATVDRSAPAYTGELGVVTVYGTVTESLGDAPQLSLRDSAGRILRVYATDDLLVRTRAGGTTTADKLKAADSVVVKAYRDSDGNYIAQTIRIR